MVRASSGFLSSQRTTCTLRGTDRFRDFLEENRMFCADRHARSKRYLEESLPKPSGKLEIVSSKDDSWTRFLPLNRSAWNVGGTPPGTVGLEVERPRFSRPFGKFFASRSSLRTVGHGT